MDSFALIAISVGTQVLFRSHVKKEVFVQVVVPSE